MHGTLQGAGVKGGSYAHLGGPTAGYFTLSADLEVWGCTIYTTPFDGGIAAGTLIGISRDLAGLSTIPWIANAPLASSVAVGSNAATVEFARPVLLYAGVVYCITGDCDVTVCSGTTLSGIVSNVGHWLLGHPFVADTAGYTMPFELYGYSPPSIGRPKGSAPVDVSSSSAVRNLSGLVKATGISPVNVSSLDAEYNGLRTSGLSPVDVFSLNAIEVDLQPYSGEDIGVQIPFELSGVMDPIFPPPVPPVDFEGLLDPTVAPTASVSTTSDGHLPPGSYRYSYAAWKGSHAQATAPSPTVDVTLTSENTVTLTYPTVDGADGYLVYREDL